jgi:hypothetical protein
MVFDLAQRVTNLAVQVGLGEVAIHVRHPAREPRPGRLVDLDPEVALPTKVFSMSETFAPLVDAILAMADADQRKVFRQQLGTREVVERRNHQALGEIAAGARRSPGHRDRRALPAAGRRSTVCEDDGTRIGWVSGIW